MLDLYYKENTWEPPAIAYDKLLSDIDKVPDFYKNMDYLVIRQVDPYIDSVFVHFDNTTPGNPVYMRRFTFQEEYVWDYESERLFRDRCMNNSRCGYDSAGIENIYQIYSQKHPEWHLDRYYTLPFRLLDHIYHCMRKGTAQEILYKAGLDELAAYVEEMDELNLLSSKPAEIYDGLSIKVLRALNCRGGAMLLSSSLHRNFLKDLYQKFPDLFKEKLSDAQCHYLNYLITGELTVGETGRLFKARRLNLKYMWSDSQYENFLFKIKGEEEAKKRMKQLAEMDPIYNGYYAQNDHFDEFIKDRILQTSEYLLNRKDEYNQKIRCSNRRRNYDWQERGKGYVVRYPQTINDFCREAVYMKNCLLSYVDAMVQNETTILFMRKEDDVNTPFITIEVYHNWLMQAYHRCNRDCTKDEAEWIRGYCDRHGIGIDKFRFNREVDELY